MLSPENQRQAEITLIFGRRGCGKTTLARKLISAWPRDMVRVQDPLAQFPGYRLINPAAPDLDAGMILVADELDLMCTPHGYDPGWVREVTHYGRHLGISMIGCSRRPANVHKDLTALASTVYLGRITEPRDLDYCASAWGDGCAMACKLENFHFMLLRP